MKRKQQSLKKLALNKRSIVALNAPEMGQLQGGDPRTIENTVCVSITSNQIACPGSVGSYCVTYFCMTPACATNPTGV
jgi:hypothetical protein